MRTRDIAVQEFEFKVTRKVIKVEESMMDNYQLELFMDDFGYKAGPDTEQPYTWSGPEPKVTGFWFRAYNDEYGETYHVKFGDYIIITGYGDAYAMSAAKFIESGATPKA